MYAKVYKMNKEEKPPKEDKPKKKEEEWKKGDWIAIGLASLILLSTAFYLIVTYDPDAPQICHIKYINEGEVCTIINSYKNLCAQTNQTTSGMRQSACICKDYKFVCLEDLVE